MSWDKLTDEKPSAEFRDRVLRAADVELAKLRGEPVPFWRRRWVTVIAMAALALAVLPKLFLSRREESLSAPEDVAIAVTPPEMLENADLLGSLDMLEDLDVLLEWDGKEV